MILRCATNGKLACRTNGGDLHYMTPELGREPAARSASHVRQGPCTPCAQVTFLVIDKFPDPDPEYLKRKGNVAWMNDAASWHGPRLLRLQTVRLNKGVGRPSLNLRQEYACVLQGVRFSKQQIPRGI